MYAHRRTPFVALNDSQTRVLLQHGSCVGVGKKTRVRQFGDNWSVFNPETGRLHVHKSDKQKSAKQELVFESIHSVCNTLTSHSVKFWDLNRIATSRELARLQGFPDWFKVPEKNASDLFGNAVCVPVAEFCARWIKRELPDVKSCVDVCSGIGGFHVAAVSAGIECVGFSEVKRSAIECYKDNFPYCMWLGDLKTAEWPLADVVFCGFPCQPFSRSMQTQDRKEHKSWPISAMLPHVVDKTQARAFVFENVLSIRKLGEDTMHDLTLAMNKRGFSTKAIVLNARDFGVPQQRKRVFLLGVKTGSTLDLLPPVTTREKNACIGDILECKLPLSTAIPL